MRKITTQLRLPEEVHDYICFEAERMGISRNAAILTLIADGKQLRKMASLAHPLAEQDHSLLRIEQCSA